MTTTIRMLIPLLLLCLPYLTTVDCRFKGKITYTYKSKLWQKNLPDSRKLNELALIGTRDPPSFESSFRNLPRLLPLPDKLTVGIRVFDMGVRRINNDFAMYNSSFDMRAQFKNLVNGVKTFLKKHPTEFVIMIMHAESTPVNSTLSECEILTTKYVQKYRNLFVQNWSLEDTVGQHRGKILLLEKSPEFTGCSTHLPCTVRDQQSVDVPDNFNEHYDYVERLQAEVRTRNSKCYLFYYTTRRDVTFPPKMTALEKADYMIDQKSSPVPQTIGLIPTHFNNTRNSLHITVADLPTVEVINTIIDSN